MPLIIMCGLPGSGKSTRCDEFRQHCLSDNSIKAAVISDNRPDIVKNFAFTDTTAEKNLRSTLKSEVLRFVNMDDVLILDAGNYIKGYRYELYCASKSAHTTQCIIYCAVNTDLAWQWNEARPVSDQYSRQVFDALVMRFETPDDRNRWDSPLFIVHPGDALPYQKILDALYHRAAPPPNLSTLSQPLSSTNFLQELDMKTQAIVSALIDSHKTAVVGDAVTVPGAQHKVHLTRTLSPAELQKIRRQFIAYSKSRPPLGDSSKLPDLFVQFLSDRI